MSRAINWLALSAEWLGPVHHNQPGLPASRTLNGLFMGALERVSDSEADFRARRLAMLAESHVPWCLPDTPCRWRWTAADGAPFYPTHLQIKELFAALYVHAVQPTHAFRAAQSKWRSIPLPGARPGEGPLESAQGAFLDADAAFGDAHVLWCMMALPAAQWPWVTHSTLWD